ncbi:spliceosomal snRNP component, partial [Coemansia guatemalensis]
QLLQDDCVPLSTSLGPSASTSSEQLPDYLRPSANWLDAFTGYFAQEQTGFRLLLDKTSIPQDFSIPHSDRLREWRSFCYGIDEDRSTKNSIVYALASADQMMAIRLIKWMTAWMAIDQLRRIEGIWLWYLILRLDSLLDHDDTHVLRELCRRLISIRSNIGHNIGQNAETQLDHRRNEIAAINILIAAVTRGYKQYDLELL